MCKDVYRGAEMEKDTPVTKLDSVERLTEKAIDEITEVLDMRRAFRENVYASVRAALTEMRDLSRREALREAAKVARSYKMGRDLPIPAANVDLGFETLARDLERMAVEEGTK